VRLLFPCGLAYSSQNPTVNIHDLPVDESAGTAGKENYRSSKIVWVSPSPCRCAVNYKIIEWMSVNPDWCCLLCSKIARSNSIYLNIIFGPFCGKVSSQHF